LLEHEAYALLPALGIRVPEHLFVPFRDKINPDLTSLTFDARRLVAKVVAEGLLHKSDGGGVLFIDNDPDEIIRAHGLLLERFPSARGILFTEWIEHDASPASELLLGIRNTPDFGPIVTIGAGGVLTEFLSANLLPGREIAIFSPAVDTPASIERALREKVITRLVTGDARGQKAKMALNELVALVTSALGFASSHVPGDIAELEINPFVPTRKGGIALDAVVRLAGPETPIPAPRPLEKIDRLLHPRSIAIAGVSRSANPGRTMLNNLLSAGYPADSITVIKEGEEAIAGCRCVANLEALPAQVDLLLLAVPAEAIPEAIETAVEQQSAESILVIPGGLGESAGSTPLETRIREALDRSRESSWGGPVVNGGNCLGFHSRPGSVDTIFLPTWKLEDPEQPRSEAPVAIVSQSGALAVSKLTKLAQLAPRYLISIGNQMDLTAADYLEWLGRDASIEVFAFYVEGFRPLDGERWVRAAQAIRMTGRPVILYRAGRTPAGQKATASHTAIVAGDAAVARELARTAGALTAETIEELEDLIRLFTLLRDRRPAGRRLAAMSNAGFESVAFADHAGDLALTSLAEPTRARLEKIVESSRLERIVTIANPLDVNPMMGDEAFAAAAAAILEDGGSDLAVVGCIPLTPALNTLAASPNHSENIDDDSSVVSRLLALRNSPKPWVAVIDAGSLYDPMASRLERGGVPVFRTADRALRALNRWVEWHLRDA
ncbi:MAG: acetate--CoA ligase family protein, partial [Thermoanaerobaculia bacterium]